MADQVRPGVYARVSSEEQAKNSSIDDQIARGRAAAKQRGWGAPAIYPDEGATGTNAERPQWQRLLTDCRAGLIDVVIATKWDRVARDARVGLNIVAQLESLGVSLVVVEADFDTTTPTGKLMRHQMIGFAAFDRDSLVERMGRGQHAMAERGGWPGGKQAPYGYMAVGGGRDNRLVVNQQEAEVLRLVVGWVVDEHLTTGQAARRLNSNGISTRTGVAWTHQNLRRHLTERKLLGEIQWGRTERTYRSSRATGKYGPTVTLQCEPILSKERFESLQVAMSLRARGPNQARKIYPLSGRLVCHCGQPFGGCYRADRQLRQYRCRAAKWTAVGDPSCDARRIEADWIEDAVWQEVVQLLSQPDRLLETVEDYISLRTSQVAVERDESSHVGANITRLERALARALRSAFMDDEPDAHENVIRQIQTELAAARQRQQQLEAWKRESQAESSRMRDVWALAEVAVQRLGGMSLQQRAEVMSLLDIRVTVLDPRTDGPARGGFRGGLGPARPRVRVEGSVPHARLLDLVVNPENPSVAGRSVRDSQVTSRIPFTVTLPAA